MPPAPEQQDLKQAALDATPGPWHISEPSQQLHPVRAKDCIVADVGFSGSLDKDANNAAYLAAANPAAILALLTQLEAQGAERDKLLAIIASAYQIAGLHDAPAHILDVLADPEAATVEQVEAMLPYQVAQPTPDEMIDKLRALRIALERRAPLIWDDASHDWNDACGGPPVHEIFANRLISAFFEGVPDGPDEGRVG